MVTHDQAEAMAISDRILLLNKGKIEQQGTPQSMYEAPDTLFTAEFMGSNNRLPARVVARSGGAARLQVEGMALNATARGSGASDPDVEASALIRVEEVRIGRTPVDNGIQLPLSTCMYLGDRWECLFKHGNSSVRAYSKHRVDPGQYWLEMPAEKLWVF
jgi:iron(III) transport system ATP-binding protein